MVSLESFVCLAYTLTAKLFENDQSDKKNMKKVEKSSSTRVRVSERNTLGNKGRFIEEGKPLYEYLDVTPDFSGQASLGRHFIYALVFNLGEGNAEVPFFLGQTNKLEQRLQSHKFVSWHVDRFNRPAKVRILGTISELLTNKALADLTQRILSQGGLLKSIPVDKNGYLGRRTNKQLHEYVHSAGSPERTYKSWLTFWQKEEPAGKARVEERVDEFVIVTKPDVISYINHRSYSSPWTSKFSHQLAAAYDPLAEESILRLPYHERLETRLRTLSEAVDNVAHLNGDWYTSDRLVLDTPVRFKLSAALLRSIQTGKATTQYTRGTKNKFDTTFTASEIIKEILEMNMNAEIAHMNTQIVYYFDFEKQSARVPKNIVAAQKPSNEIWQEVENGALNIVYSLTSSLQQKIKSRRNLGESYKLEFSKLLMNNTGKKNISKKDLLKYMIGKQVESVEAKRLIMKITHSYDSEAKSSILNNLPDTNFTSRIKLENLKSDIQSISNIWFTNSKIEKGVPIEFFLRLEVINAILKS